jgi:hypothetical protein
MKVGIITQAKLSNPRASINVSMLCPNDHGNNGSTKFLFPLEKKAAMQGCQIFLGTIYQNGKNIPK